MQLEEILQQIKPLHENAQAILNEMVTFDEIAMDNSKLVDIRTP